MSFGPIDLSPTIPEPFTLGPQPLDLSSLPWPFMQLLFSGLSVQLYARKLFVDSSPGSLPGWELGRCVQIRIWT